MKKLLLLGALLSTVAMAQVVEVRVGGDLSNSGKFHGGFSSGANLEKKAIKKGLVLPSDQQILALVPMPNHNDMISHLTFGFWVHLLNPDPIKNPNTTYWQNIFTNLNLFTRLQDVLRFRNDLYHQEAVWKNKGIKNPIKALQNLETKFNNFLGYLSKISPERFTTINESYNLTNVMKQMFDQHKFSVEIENLREIFIGPGLTN